MTQLELHGSPQTNSPAANREQAENSNKLERQTDTNSTELLVADEEAGETLKDESPQYKEYDPNFYIFGYGSLIWKPPPYVEKAIPGFIKGYVRRFWQYSEDHRGVPGSPGNVVTLIEKEFWETLDDPHVKLDIPGNAQDRESADTVWGMLYKIQPDKVKQVSDYLDLREQFGYSVHKTIFYPAGLYTPQNKELARLTHESSLASSKGVKPIKDAIVYIGTPDNMAFSGPLDLDHLASSIATRKGPSGTNREYLFNLASALSTLSQHSSDYHIENLRDRVLQLERELHS